MDFQASDPHTVGIELEFQLLDAATLDLADRIVPLMALLPNEPHIKPEFLQNTVEVTSGIHTDLAGLEADLREQTERVATRCRELGIRLAGAGTHPFSERLSGLTPAPRFRRLEQLGGLLAHNQITFAMHVHLGVASREELIALTRAFGAFVPLMIALSANSPFWRGYDTGFSAYRQRVLAASPNYGIAPRFEHWGAFVALVGALERAGVVSTLRDLHWDLRPRPDFGTLEIRVMDAQPTVRQAVTLAGFVRALAFLLRRPPAAWARAGRWKPLHPWLEKHNHFEASRLGMEANLIVDDDGKVQPLGELFDDLMKEVAPVSETLAQGAYLDDLRRLAADGPGYRQQWAALEAGGTLERVTAALADALEAELSAG